MTRYEITILDRMEDIRFNVVVTGLNIKQKSERTVECDGLLLSFYDDIEEIRKIKDYDIVLEE